MEFRHRIAWFKPSLYLLASTFEGLAKSARRYPAPLIAEPLDGRTGTIQNAGLLETIAEVSVAFAGFAGIVSVFGRSQIDPAVRMWRIRIMILTSLFTLMFAFLPAILHQFRMPETALWRFGALLLGTGMAGQFFLVFRWMPVSYRQSFSTQPMGLVLTVSSITFVITQIFVAFGMAPTFAPALYSCGLLYLLLLSSYHFFRLIMAVQPTE
jgi:hypothetical protein